MSIEQLSKLYIKPRRNKLLLLLRLNLDNIPIFWWLIKTPYGHKVLLDQPLLYLTLLP